MLAHIGVVEELIHGDLRIYLVHVCCVDYHAAVGRMHHGLPTHHVVLGVHHLLHVLVEPFLSVFVQVL